MRNLRCLSKYHAALQKARKRKEYVTIASLLMVGAIVLYFKFPSQQFPSHTTADDIRVVAVDYSPRQSRTVRFFIQKPLMWTRQVFCHFWVNEKSTIVAADMTSLETKLQDAYFQVDCRIPQALVISPALQVSLSLWTRDVGPERFDLPWNGKRQKAPRGVLRPAGDSFPLLRVTQAYLDPRYYRVVRFVGIGRVVRQENIYCHFHHRRKSATTRGTLERVLKAHQIEFDGCFILCPFPRSVRRLSPSSRVSLSQAERSPGSVRFQLTWIPHRPPEVPTIALCTAPVFGRVSAMRMIAWVEMNRLLGVNHFMIYDFDMNRKLYDLMAYYRSGGVVTHVKWNTGSIPVSREAMWPPPKEKVHYYGQFAANNDCLYRLGNRYRFLMFTDLDEIIVPLKTVTLIDYLRSVDRNNISHFRFRNTYVRTDYPKDGRARQIDPYIGAHDIPFLDFTRREKRILDSNTGPKVVVKFENSLVMGVHELISGLQPTYDVPVDEALLFHYRPPPQYLNVSDEGKISERLTDFVPLLIGRIRKVLKEIND